MDGLALTHAGTALCTPHPEERRAHGAELPVSVASRVRTRGALNTCRLVTGLSGGRVIYMIHPLFTHDGEWNEPWNEQV